MKIGDQVETLYAGEWVPGTIQSFQNAEADPKQSPVRLYTVATEKGMVLGVAIEHGNLREKKVSHGS